MSNKKSKMIRNIESLRLKMGAINMDKDEILLYLVKNRVCR